MGSSLYVQKLNFNPITKIVKKDKTHAFVALFKTWLAVTCSMEDLAQRNLVLQMSNIE